MFLRGRRACRSWFALLTQAGRRPSAVSILTALLSASTDKSALDYLARNTTMGTHGGSRPVDRSVDSLVDPKHTSPIHLLSIHQHKVN